MKLFAIASAFWFAVVGQYAIAATIFILWIVGVFDEQE